MFSYVNWIAAAGATAAERAIEEDRHAADTWQVIQDNPISIVFRTAAGVSLAAQTVRIDSDNSASDAESAAGAAPKRKVIITGVKGHPTIADADIKERYTFVLDNDLYRVVDVLPGIIGEVQAVAESSG